MMLQRCEHLSCRGEHLSSRGMKTASWHHMHNIGMVRSGPGPARASEDNLDHRWVCSVVIRCESCAC